MYRKLWIHQRIYILSIVLLVLLPMLVSSCATATPTATEVVDVATVEPVLPTDVPTVPPAELAILPSVSVDDQELADDRVMIAEVVSDSAGWIVIHADDAGKPGLILGYSSVDEGSNRDIIVDIDSAKATDTLYAMLHTDAGEIGVWEFPDGPDLPVKVSNQVITPPFEVTGGLITYEPEVIVDNSILDDGTITISRIVSMVPGWIVIHADDDGRPGSILGYSAVSNGENLDVVVEIDETNITKNLHAMLHMDAGVPNVWEFPDGPDAPVMLADQMVLNTFAVDLSSIGEPILLLGGNDILGDFLVAENGMTLYTYSNDDVGQSNCYDSCAVNWPPLLVESDQMLIAGDGINGELGVIERQDSMQQLTYAGMPLYFWAADQSSGDTSGHAVNRAWAVARPQTPVLQLGGNPKLGRFLTDSNGMSLYIFSRDFPGVSNCSDQCAVNWPPLILADDQPLTGGAGVIGELSTIQRVDGSLQVTYNGMPLYRWIDDTAPGDADGHGVNGAWIVANQWASLTSFQNDDQNVNNGGGDDGY